MERENRKLFEDQDCTLVWDIVNGVIEEISFEYPDNTIEILWSGVSYDQAERIYNNALEYLE